MTLAPYVRILGRGPGRSRSLTREEASEAMALIMSKTAEPEAIGALLMLLRFRGETAEEVAGFVSAVRASLPDWDGSRPALDWPSYAAGRTRGLPWFLLSAKLVSTAGVPVLLHGWNSHQNPIASVRASLPEVGIKVATSTADAALLLQQDGIAYLPLETYSPRLLELLTLRDVLGLRSAVNTVLRVLNPAGADASVQGVFHPPYRALQADAGALLGQRNLTILKGGGGEFERHPSKALELFGLRDGQDWHETATILIDETMRLADASETPSDLADLWAGKIDLPVAEAIVIGTAALALETCGKAAGGAGLDLAKSLWQSRLSAQAA